MSGWKGDVSILPPVGPSVSGTALFSVHQEQMTVDRDLGIVVPTVRSWGGEILVTEVHQVHQKLPTGVPSPAERLAEWGTLWIGCHAANHPAGKAIATQLITWTNYTTNARYLRVQVQGSGPPPWNTNTPTQGEQQ